MSEIDVLNELNNDTYVSKNKTEKKKKEMKKK